MSLGNLFSGISGAVVGFFAGGGPTGAIIGFCIGLGMSVAMDALMPDIPSPGQPQTAELAFPTAEEGKSIPDVLGTTKLSGNIFQYFGNRKKIIKKKHGKSKGTVVRIDYYLSWAMGICLGPVDALYTIFAGDDVMWEGTLTRPETGGVEIIALGYEGVEGQEGRELGNIYFYFGTDDQGINSDMQSEISNTPAYRGFCYAFFDDCFIGTYNRVPSIKFVLKKTPALDFNANHAIGEYDYNPIHAIWYIFTNEMMAMLPEEFLDETTFSDTADTIYTEERGVSILFDRQQTSLAYLETLLNHIGAIIRYSCSGDLKDE